MGFYLNKRKRKMKIVILSLLLVALIVSAEAAPNKKGMKVIKQCKGSCSRVCPGNVAQKLKKPCKDECFGAIMNFFTEACENCARKNGEGDCYKCMKTCIKTAIATMKNQW